MKKSNHSKKSIGTGNPDEPDPQCPFCLPDAGSELIKECGTAFAIFDKYPVSRGHVLVIPKRHCSDYFDLTSVEQAACWQLLNIVAANLQERYNPNGFNIGVNIGKAAGQTISHVHLHLIPRYEGDVDEPEGGIRGVIPWKQKY